MVGRVDGMTDTPQPVLAKPSVLGETADGANGVRKTANGEETECHAREESTRDGAMVSQVRMGLQFLWDSYVCACKLPPIPGSSPWNGRNSADWG